jgi:hypothetical protein
MIPQCRNLQPAVGWNGHIYSMLILTNTEMFFHRKDLFKESGVDRLGLQAGRLNHALGGAACWRTQ